mmetsp:Transcript_100437/g.259415  ORF Transcript_100437/g.259415 Transcript_100437/m.259415 type:complete len:209 (-) Transcript_100437:331-957(-)
MSLTPMKIRTAATPYLSSEKRRTSTSMMKKVARRPSIANTAEVYARKRSFTWATIALTESTAKRRSLSSTTMRDASMGVACRRPLIRSTNLSMAFDSAWYGITAVMHRIIQELPFLWASTASSSSAPSSSSANILYADQRSTAPKRYTALSKRSMSATPAKMKMARKITAPRMPHLSTGPWWAGFMRKLRKMRAMTTRLSTLRLFSTK